VRPATLPQGGREKAYRPLPHRERRKALLAAVAAWHRGDWFETHELLEPAWMGAADPVERDLYQGLIKLAAAYVHRARGNAVGMAKNLAGADERLGRVARERAVVEGVDVRALLAAVRGRLPAQGRPADVAVEPPVVTLSQEG
jgi:predicted metal-dependent hydrolase